MIKKTLILYWVLIFGGQNAYSVTLTILTCPIGSNSCGGHPAVVRSLVAGLKKMGISFNKNPRYEEDVSDHVVVLANVQALKQAISWKRSGKIKKLFAGPNLMTRADEHGGVLGISEIDICIVPSDWVKKAYEEELPALKGRVVCWYAGIDPRFWKPECLLSEKSLRNVLVYWKTEPESFCIAVEKILMNFGFNPIRMQYGKYDLHSYKRIATQCLFAVFISRSESQGIALAEVWAMDIPTLVWNPKKLKAHNRVYSIVSSCPYLCEKTGKDWGNFKDFKQLISTVDELLPSFTPRTWILENMTDEKSAQLMIDIIRQTD